MLSLISISFTELVSSPYHRYFHHSNIQLINSTFQHLRQLLFLFSSSPATDSLNLPSRSEVKSTVFEPAEITYRLPSTSGRCYSRNTLAEGLLTDLSLRVPFHAFIHADIHSLCQRLQQFSVSANQDRLSNYLSCVSTRTVPFMRQYLMQLCRVNVIVDGMLCMCAQSMCSFVADSSCR